MKQFIIPFLLFIVMSSTAQVEIQKINYKGWEEAIELRNDEIKVIVVPQIGRIMHFSYLNWENILYENEALEGQVYSADNPYKVDGQLAHAGFGGDRIWPTIQDSFVVYNGSRGLSDPWIDGSPWQAELVENGVKISSQVSKYLGVRVSRTIVLANKGATVHIKQKMEKIQEAEQKKHEPVPLTLWNLSKIKNPLFGLLPLSENSVFKNSIEFQKWPDNENSAPKNYSQHGQVGQLVPVPELFQKMGADSKGWVAGVYDNMVFGQLFQFDPNENYPDGGTSATIFTCTNFTELECLSPEKKLKPGESLEFDIQWRLKTIRGNAPEKKREDAVKWLNSLLNP